MRPSAYELPSRRTAVKTLLLLTIACLSGCATNLTLNSTPVAPELLTPCGDTIAQPLVEADIYDISRALTEAVDYAKECRAKQQNLITAVKAREQINNDIKTTIAGQ